MALKLAFAIVAVVSIEDTISVRPTVSKGIEVCNPFFTIEWWASSISIVDVVVVGSSGRSVCAQLIDQCSVGIKCLSELFGEHFVGTGEGMVGSS